MKRPHSAKPIRNFLAQPNEGGIGFEEPIKHFMKAGKKQMFNALSASNDLSRMLPKKIQQDKERLYCQTLHLKTNLNQMAEENLRLKTKIATLQKQKDRLQQNEQSTIGKGKSSNALTLNSKNDKQNAIVSNLKKMVRQSRQQNQNLSNQITKLKRAIRYTKINEVEVQKQTIYQENKRLAKFIENLSSELESRVRQDEQVSNLQNQLGQKIRQLKEVTSDNIKYEQILEELQMKYRQSNEKFIIQQKKWQRDISLQKHKIDQLNKQVQLLKYQIKTLKEKAEEQKKNNAQSKRTVRPNSSHNRSNATVKNNKQKQQALKINQKLKQEVEEAKRKLTQYQHKLKAKQNLPSKLQLETKNQPFSLVLTHNQLNQFIRNNKQEEYGQDFQQHTTRPNNITELPIEEKKMKRGQNGQKKSDKNNAQMMNEIRQILTLRMKYNRYPFEQLKSDIQASPLTSFSLQDLINMLMAEPFYLTKHYAQQFLKICFGKDKIMIDDQLQTKRLLQNLRLVIDDFTFLEDQQQEKELYRLAQIMTHNRTQLQSKLQQKSKNHCVTKNELAYALRKYANLNEEQINLAICYISINIQTLNAINYSQFLDRFYIKNSKSLNNELQNQSNLAKSQELSLGENQDLDEGELIGDDQLV